MTPGRLFDVQVPMADGVSLSADVVLPAPAPAAAWPAILIRTPYSKVNDRILAWADFFSDYGYAVVTPGRPALGRPPPNRSRSTTTSVDEDRGSRCPLQPIPVMRRQHAEHGTGRVEVFARVSGIPARYEQQPIARLREASAEMAAMFDWFDREGYQADLPALRRLRPALTSLESWLRDVGWTPAAPGSG